MLGHDVLHLDGVHVLATGNDHVLDPVDHVDVTAFVHVAAVSRVHPARADGLGGRFRLLPVAEHHVLPAATISPTVPRGTSSPFSSTIFTRA
jgi:hypothetical protein